MRAVARLCAAALLAAAAALLFAPWSAAAQDLFGEDEEAGADYALDNERWNGLSTLAAVARGLGLEVSAQTSFDWSELGANDVLLLVYPTSRVDAAKLSSFVRGGGRVLVADDFGDGDEAMNRLGATRRPTGTGIDAVRYHDDQPFAPVARPHDAAHPLAAGVAELVTNHPAVLGRVRGAQVVFGFGDGQGVVAAGGLGAGRFVVLSDPSVLINRMLQFEGNLQFAINTLRYLASGGPDGRLILVVGDFSAWGQPRAVADDGTLRGTIGSQVRSVNDWLGESNEYLLTEDAMKVLAILASLLIAALSLASLPLARRADLSGGWTRAGPLEQVDDYARLVAHYDRLGPRANYLLPATALRDAASIRLARALDASDPLHGLRDDELYAALEARCGPEAVAALSPLLSRLRALPSRLQAASPWSSAHMSRREFERLGHDVDRLCRTLGGP
jgi:hypothetical protein